jgi:hypothetical protein
LSLSKPIATGVFPDMTNFSWAAARIKQLAAEGITFEGKS